MYRDLFYAYDIVYTSICSHTIRVKYDLVFITFFDNGDPKPLASNKFPF
jgi:hypothetical protein